MRNDHLTTLNAIAQKLSDFESENDPGQDLHFFQEIQADLEKVRNEELECFDDLEVVDFLNGAINEIQRCLHESEEAIQLTGEWNSYKVDREDLDSAISWIQESTSAIQEANSRMSNQGRQHIS